MLCDQCNRMIPAESYWCRHLDCAQVARAIKRDQSIADQRGLNSSARVRDLRYAKQPRRPFRPENRVQGRG